MHANGTFVVGTVIGFESTPWPKDATKFNHRLGIKTGEYTKSFGITEDNIQVVDIQDQDVPRMQQDIKNLVGKRVAIPTVFRARKGGQQGAFLSCFAPKDFKMITLPDLKD